MASEFTHVFAAAALGAAVLPSPRSRVVVAGVVCAALPDVDVLGFGLGISYGDVLGHRGLTHSLPFAAILASVVVAAWFRARRWRGLRLRVGLYLFAATASHGLLDALTSGGLGVAFLAPFDASRWFFPVRPVEVSPIGVAAFFSARGVAVLVSEFVWIVLPWSAACLGLGAAMRAIDRRRAQASSDS